MTAPEHSLKISRVLHAGYIFDHVGSRIIFDPIFENPFSWNCHAFPNIRFDEAQIRQLKFDAIFISHYHDDHCSFESLNLLDRATPIYIYCLHLEMRDLLHKLGYQTVHFMRLNLPVRVGGLTITALKALDEDVDCVFHIQAAGLNVLNVVDAWIAAETLSALNLLAPWDLVLWPFQTLREVEVLTPSLRSGGPAEIPPEWLEQIQKLRPRFVVPSSCQFRMEDWSWYNGWLFPNSYAFFASELALKVPTTHVLRMEPGTVAELTSESMERLESLAWIEPLGEQNVDYEFDSHLLPPRTADIAKKFAPLIPQEFEHVINFCRFELSKAFRELEPAEERYFKQAKTWRLALYDHQGQPLHFCFRIEKQSLELISHTDLPIDWLTEVPIAKLYSALVHGESLTSMYVRINDYPFAPEIKEVLGQVDVLGDPLLRCLFNGAFGGYQRAQLRRLGLET
jgi:hypothetical protein